MQRAALLAWPYSLLLIALVVFTCSDKENSSEAAWNRFTIDASLLGADGVRVEDANGDGVADIVTGWEQSGLTRIYFNPGKEVVKSQWKYVSVGVSPDVEDAVLVDLDGDGSKDVVSSSEGETKRINIHWAPAEEKDYYDSSHWVTEVIPVTNNFSQWMFAVPAQIDGENGIDLIVAGKQDNDKYPQSFIGWLRAPVNARGLSEWEWIPLAKVQWVMSVFFSDINGDGNKDIVFTERKGNTPGVKWLENPGPAQIKHQWRYHSIGDTTTTVLFMELDDLDSDGKEDVIVATEQDGIHFIQKRSDDGVQWKTHKISFPENVGDRGKAVTVADITGDGKKELILSFEKAGGSKSGVVYLTFTTSVFDPEWTRHEVSGGEGIKYDLVPAIDIDRDGDLDIVSTEENNNSQGNIPGLGLIWYENPQVKKEN